MLRKAVLCALMLAGMNAFAVSGENIKDYMSKRKVIVNTSKAELCFADEKKCHPVLIGKTTPKGTFSMNIYKTDKAGYGGDVIGFKQEKDFLFALHRVWTLKPSERRMERIQRLHQRNQRCVQQTENVFCFGSDLRPSERRKTDCGGSPFFYLPFRGGRI